MKETKNNIKTGIGTEERSKAISPNNASLRGTKQSPTHIPKLRFKEFDGEWMLIKVLDFAPLQRGFDLPVVNIKNGNYPVVFSNGVLKTHNEFKVKAPGVVTGRSGTIGKVTFVEENYWPHNTSLWVTNFKNNAPKYVFYFYLNFKLERLGTGSGVPTLNRNDVHAQKRFVPSLPEQQKIASFLTSVDTKIQQLTKKKELLEQYKKGVMQQLFSGKLRFKPDATKTNVTARTQDEAVSQNKTEYPDWEEKRLLKFCSFFSGGTPSSTNKEYYSGTIPFIGSGNIYDSEVNSFISEEALNNSSAKIVQKGDLLYALYGANSGELSISKLEGAINQAILCIRTKQSIEYLYYILLHNKDRIVAKYLQGGQGNLSSQTIKKLKYKFPCLEEQQKIATFLSSIDTKIESVHHQITQTQSFKKGLLQQMFV